MAYIYDLSDTWNAAGTVFYGIKLNVTNSASASGSKLISIQAGGSEKFGVDASGNVGIGTSSPQDKLEVYGGNVRSALAGTSASTLRGFAMASGTTEIASLKTEASFGETRLTSGFSGFGGFTTFHTNGTERMRIDSSGNLGIGTSSPAFALDVAAASARIRVAPSTTTNSALFQSTNAGGNAYLGLDNSAGGLGGAYALNVWHSGAYPIVFATSNTERVRIDSSGNVGIGTSSPDQKLVVNGSARVNADIVGAAGNTGALGVYGGASYTGGSGIVLYGSSHAVSPNVITFSNGAYTERMRIDSSGNMLVGTTTNGGVGLSVSVDTYGRSVIHNTSYASGFAAEQFRYNGTTVGTIQINTTSTAYNTSSDARLKHDIVDAPEASSLIDAIKVRSFKWNADNSEQRYGFIAQELLEVAPEAVSVPANEDQMMGVDYSKLVPMLVKEIQSLRARVAQLEGN